MGQDAAGQELAELLFHELGEAGAVDALGRFLEEGLQVGADDGVEDAALGVAWAVGWAREGHGPHVRPARGPRQCPKRNTPDRWGPMRGRPLRAGRLLPGTAQANRLAP